jgi:hypothetical protein
VKSYVSDLDSYSARRTAADFFFPPAAASFGAAPLIL